MLGQLPCAVSRRRGHPQRIDPQETIVASTCELCAKGPSFGKSVSHSHRRTSRRWNPNIQTVRAVIKGTPTRLNVCTSCLKAGKVQQISA